MKTKGYGIASPFIHFLALVSGVTVAEDTSAVAKAMCSATGSPLAEVMMGNQNLAHQIRGNCPDDSCTTIKNNTLIDIFTATTDKRDAASIDYVVIKECSIDCDRSKKLQTYFDGQYNLIGSVEEEVHRAFIEKNDEAAHRLDRNCNQNTALGKQIRETILNLPEETRESVEAGSLLEYLLQRCS